MSSFPPKYAYLKQAEDAGLNVPRTVFLEHYPTTQELTAFAQGFAKDALLIVRSANATEDSAQHSLAGHFWSSEPVPLNQLAHTIQQAWEKNQYILQNLGYALAPQLMVQRYITPAVGGVLFTPWGFFSEYFQVDCAQSAQAAVEGHAETAVLSVQASVRDPLQLPTQWAFLREALQQLAQQLRQTFQFPVDCEWVFDSTKQQMFIVQVRPQTHLTGAIKPLTQEVLRQYPLPRGTWTYSAFSESLGKISPLSFDLLQALYQASRATFKQLGFAAQNADFLYHAPDGTVLIDEQREAAFFKLTGFGGFWQGLRAPKLKLASEQFLQTWQAEQAFDFITLSTAFTYWLFAAFMAKGEGRAVVAPAHVYELMWPNVLTIPEPPHLPSTWLSLSQALREVFWFELNKLKHVIAQQASSVVFCTWSEYQKQDFSQAELRQHGLAPLAIYDHALLPVDNEAVLFQSFSAVKTVSGAVFIISQPSQFQADIPANSILIAPYFDNRWVAQLKNLSAVMVEHGGRLSHAALVARELGVPFCVVSPALIVDLKMGDIVTLDIARQMLSKV
ncbi:PEP-utilizing enzyme [Thiolinea disciformis]|uniref:PEP-utilizing enzyme n=1 Tax=Thiolinea disciformis TaxID=125614 RepID=UPI000368AE2E|nr:PEP-utilizing enzyme [Thiolinea disciformis]